MSQPQKVMVDGVWRPLMTSAKQPAKECCCDGSCCMYPASGLENGDFTGADLPEDLSVYGDIYSGSLSKGGIAPTYYTGTVSYAGVSSDARIELYGADITGGEPVWALIINIDGIGDTEFSLQPCLITGDGNLTPGDDTVEDQFTPTYSLEFHVATPGTTTVTRTSLCEWSGELTSFGNTFPVLLYYDPTSCIWTLYNNFLNMTFVKMTTNNDPLGDYDDNDAFPWATISP